MRGPSAIGLVQMSSGSAVVGADTWQCMADAATRVSNGYATAKLHAPDPADLKSAVTIALALQDTPNALAAPTMRSHLTTALSLDANLEVLKPPADFHSYDQNVRAMSFESSHRPHG